MHVGLVKFSLFLQWTTLCIQGFPLATAEERLMFVNMGEMHSQACWRLGR